MIAENEYNIIKPVENLQNVAGLTPIDRRAEKKRRQSRQQQGSRAGGQNREQPLPDDTNAGAGENKLDPHSIDYRA